MIKKFALPIAFFIVFSLIGLTVSAFKMNINYLILFSSIGFSAALAEWLALYFPKKKQLIRRLNQVFVGGGLFFGLSIFGNVNFQSAQIVFDFLAFTVTGAFIQFVIARLILPFFIGNGFCSRACWDGAFFEFMQKKIPPVKIPKKRNNYIAAVYILFIIITAAAASLFSNPAIHEEYKRFWTIGETALILSIGTGLSFFWGSRTYCRTFCPFITVSGLISKYSIFKITPENSNACTNCGLCNKNCPMLVNVKLFVNSGKRINDRNCIVCERCVSNCPNNCLNLSPDLPWK